MAAFCKAVTLRDYTPCKNAAIQDKETCSCHKKFYDRQTWINTFIKGENRHGDTVLLGYTSTESTMHRLEKHVRDVLTSGKVKVTKDDVASIPCSETYVDIFLILCELPYVNPEWNKSLLLRTIGYYYNVARILSPQPPLPLQRVRLDPLKNNKHMGFARTLKYMLKLRDKRQNTAALAHNPDSTPYEQIFQAYFTDYDQAYSWYSNDTLASMILPQKVSPRFFEENIIPLLKQNARQLRLAKKAAMDPIKEEIVAAVYHPRNVGRWLEEGGHELLDMMF
jgi:hypothetical protein